MIYKIGSTGVDVKRIQTLLGLVSDGDFGIKTEAAVKLWQKSHGMIADGIVGDITWKAMFIVDDSVEYIPLSSHVTLLPNRRIEYLVIHFTAGSKSTSGTARNIRKVFDNVNASADFVVDDDVMVQCNPDINNYYCWAVGDKKYTNTGGASLHNIATNRNTIHIEVCSSIEKGTTLNTPNHTGWYFTPQVVCNAAKLSKILMQKYNIPINRVIRHYDVSGKLCPGIPGWNTGPMYDKITGITIPSITNNDDEWKKFKQRLL